MVRLVLFLLMWTSCSVGQQWGGWGNWGHQAASPAPQQPFTQPAPTMATSMQMQFPQSVQYGLQAHHYQPVSAQNPLTHQLHQARRPYHSQNAQLNSAPWKPQQPVYFHGTQVAPHASMPQMSTVQMPRPGPSTNGPAQHGPAQHGPAQHGPAQHGPAQHGPAQHGPAQHGPAQHGPAQHVHNHHVQGHHAKPDPSANRHCHIGGSCHHHHHHGPHHHKVSHHGHQPQVHIQTPNPQTVQMPKPEPSTNGHSQQGPAQHGPAQHGPAQHGPAQHGPAQHGPAQHGPAQHGPAQHGPAQHGPAQHGHTHQHGPHHNTDSHHHRHQPHVHTHLDHAKEGMQIDEEAHKKLHEMLDREKGNLHGANSHQGPRQPNSLPPPTQEKDTSCDVSTDGAMLELSSGSSLFVSSRCPPMTWSQAVDFCQANMMSIVSLGPSVPEEEVMEVMAAAHEVGVVGFWTGGYVSHPDNTRVSNSVTWAGIQQEAEVIEPGTNDPRFGNSLESGKPEQNNRVTKPVKEHCLALLSNAFQGGQKLHDLVCRNCMTQKLPVACKTIDIMQKPLMI